MAAAAVKKSGKKPGKKPADRQAPAPKRPKVDPDVAKWVKEAPEFRDLRRPAARARALVLMTNMQEKGLLDEAGSVQVSEEEGVKAFAEFIADIDELLGELGGKPYIAYIVDVPMDDMLQFRVLIELFASRVLPDLGKG